MYYSLYLQGVNQLKIEEKIEIARCILKSAANLNMSREIILKISEKMDCYIVEYYRDVERTKNSSNE